MINYSNDNSNELYVDRDIMVLANPEIANLPNWVVALVAAGGLAAALSTAAGLLLVISASVSHDLIKRVYYPEISEKGELIAARISAFFCRMYSWIFRNKSTWFCCCCSCSSFWFGSCILLSSHSNGNFL